MRPHRQQPIRLLCPWDSPGKNTGVGCHFLLQCMKVNSESEVAQSCPTLSDPMDYSLPGSSVHGFSRQEYWSGVLLPSPIYIYLYLCKYTYAYIKWKLLSRVKFSVTPWNIQSMEISQVRILEWAAVLFSRESCQPRDWTQVSCTEGGFFTSWATREAHKLKRKA